MIMMSLMLVEPNMHGRA